MVRVLGVLLDAEDLVGEGVDVADSVTELECPCCGCIAAKADANGMFYDGQPVTCGCATLVTISGYEDEGADIYMPEEDCPPEARCHA